MALAASPGSENPSAAYLAGQQHGASLAAQHHSAATTVPAKTAPAKPPAAPNRKPAQTQTAPGQFDLAGLLKQAQALAQAQTQAQIKAIQAQQGVYTQQGQDRATQINAATQAAAKFLSGLGDQTAASYTDAAKSLGSLAQGFSGQVGTDATNAANQIQANLASLGAPADSARTATGQQSSPESLQNVLYGLGGFIPGNLLLTSGQGAAAAARALPAGVLGSGQQQAAGALAAGQDRADTLTPQILDAQGKQPGLAQSLYSSLLDGIYKNANLGLATARVNQGQQSLNLRSAMDQFNQTYKINSQKISLARLDLSARQFAQQTLQSDRSYQVALANLGIRQAADQRAATAQEYKLQNGGFTPIQINKFNATALSVADNTFKGIPRIDKTTGQPIMKKGQPVWAHPPLNYTQAIREGRKEGVPLSILLPALNGVYKPGQRGRPLTDNGTASFDFGGSPSQLTSPFAGSTRLAGPQLQQLAAQALRIAAPEYATPGNVQALVGRIMQESGGNARAVNNWDSNAIAGHPSKGILQTIDSTFAAHALPGHGNIWDPLDNAIAAIRYMISRYGHIVGPSSTGY